MLTLSHFQQVIKNNKRGEMLKEGKENKFLLSFIFRCSQQLNTSWPLRNILHFTTKRYQRNFYLLLDFLITFNLINIRRNFDFWRSLLPYMCVDVFIVPNNSCPSLDFLVARVMPKILEFPFNKYYNFEFEITYCQIRITKRTVWNFVLKWVKVQILSWGLGAGGGGVNV